MRDNAVALGLLLAGLLWLLTRKPQVATTMRQADPAVLPPEDPLGQLTNEWWIIYAAETYGYHGPITGADIAAMEAGYRPGPPPPT